MAETLSRGENLLENLEVQVKKKKNRRGQRGGNNKKPNTAVVQSVENMLVNAVEDLEIQPKRRQPRRPKIPEEEGKQKINENNYIELKKVYGIVDPPPNSLQTIETKNVADNSGSYFEFNFPPLGSSEKSIKKKHKEMKIRMREDFKTVQKDEKLNNSNIEEPSAFNPKIGNGIWSKSKATRAQNRKYVNEDIVIDKNRFFDYLPENLARELLSQSQNGRESSSAEYVEGNIRINPKNFKEAYVGMPNNEADVLIDGIQDRNRALEGDLVAVKIKPREKWRGLKTPKPQKTGTVVAILEKIHSRKIVGFLKLMPDNNKRMALFSPKDHRVPRLNIEANYCPMNFFDHPQTFSKTMFFAQITSWEDVRFARGKILSIVGETGDLKAESNAILMENDLDITPYGDELTRDLPPSDYRPTLEDINGREDWREECVFTIDPATAQDLDDAMSCKPLENGNFEVGVHISDVTHYLESNSLLDVAVSKRATTIYLSDSVHHMLPKQLCNVCSLLPGRDKLAFSIIFEITPLGEVVDHRFAKTVINSCCQFAYEHAQTMIQDPDKIWTDDELPKISGPYKISELSTVVNNLNNIAVKMRENRFINGSLRIDQPKLHVFVDRESGVPVSFTLEEQKDSNRLIEEFMLLANITAATHLYKELPNVSLLRRHNEPILRVLAETQAMLEKLGIHIDIENAGALQASLLRYQPNSERNSDKEFFLASCISKVLNALCSKTMARAVYFCTSDRMEDQFLRHYALNVPLYTHFTSPIRRYSDCIVHRLLYAAIKNDLPVPNWDSKLCARLAANCNKQKYNAKRAQEMSSELYLTALIDLKGPVISTAIVIDVKDRSIDVIVSEMGINLRIYTADMERNATVSHDKNDDVQTLKVLWKKSKALQVINVFSILNIRVLKNSETNRLHGELLEPEEMSN